jgi:hypothetical protein
MKKNIIAMILSIIFLIGVVVITLGPKNFYYRVLYFGDRIKVKTSVLIDGKEVEVDKNSIEINGAGVGKKTVKTNKNNIDLSFKGNEFSLYTIDFKAGDYTFRVGIVHYDWWNVFNFDIAIDVDTEKNVVKYKSNGTYIDKSNWKETDYNVENENEIEDLNVISVGVF